MLDNLYRAVLKHLRVLVQPKHIHSHLISPPHPDSIALDPLATFHEHVVVNNQRFVASGFRPSDARSLFVLREEGREWAGELLDIVTIQQDGIGVHRFGRVRYFKPLGSDDVPLLWAKLCVRSMMHHSSG